ncbi:molybdopterin-dependent oxidoreductase [Syntrophotalea acetylenica]|uniref:Aldehyde oxidoreductase n=1 Tax=Syntrophotalea acetylenica TaxID=29542 RepID=A0A1L3GJS9_SYNAC|nr:molybdopterin cofactor-binding domain-containing protein [Syntrophotalea acetylenica]APG26140.1 aldehyde oxidoreductase [Syntrophotalea acetylenica]APG45386.1 aldehyde oxidoreductase [Syntrophotalea acetylenica]
MALRKIWLNLNGADRMLVCDPEKDSLADVIRRAGLTGTKVGCGTGQCGSCSVILDGKVVRSCVKKIKNVPDYSKIITIEGIGTPTNLHPLQQAWITYGGVQCGFCTPGFIVSSYALLQENLNPTREKVRDWFTKNRNACRCTGYKQLVDAVMEAAKVMRGEKTMNDITYKVPEDGRIYGTNVPRPAALAKVTGTCDYGDDVALKMPPGTLHLAIVQPGVNHANIKGIDTSEAEKMPGVVKVITAKDIKGTNRIMFPLGHPRAKFNGIDRPIIADEKVFRYGDVVAVVAAETEDQARSAAKRVKLDLEELPVYMSYLEAVAPGAAEIHPGVPNMYLTMPLLKGEDTREVLDKSDYVVEGSFQTTSQPHLVIEPEVTQAYIDEDGMVTVHNKNLAQVLALIMLCPGLGIPEGNLRVIENPVGASFGYALSPASTALAAACTLALDGKPVTLTMSYAEHNAYTGKRAASYSNARLGCNKDGKITGFEFDFAYDHGAYSELGDVLTSKAIRFAGYGYNIPNARAIARCGASNQTYGTAYRSFGNSQAMTMSESMVDMLAEKAGIDPFEFRWINIARPGDLNINSYPYKEYAYEAIMKKMRLYYNEAVARAKKEDSPEKKRGVGIAIGGYNITGNPNDHAEVALELNPDGTITHWNGWEDQGQGADVGTLVHTHEALRELNLNYTQIKIIRCDTKTCPITGPAGANRSHYMAGNATKDAAKQLLEAMRKPDGTFRTYDEMVAEDIPTKYLGVFDTTDITIDLDPNTGAGDPTPEHNYAMFLAEVEVEVSTGKTTVLGVRMVYDIGEVGSVQAVDGQAYGSMMHSIGWALSENYIDNKDYDSLVKCGFRFAADIPDNMTAESVENPIPRKTAAQGSVGCCEVFQSATQSAILNAINKAVGVRIYSLPATPDKVKEAMNAKAQGKEIKPEKFFLGSGLFEELDYIAEHPVEAAGPGMAL